MATVYKNCEQIVSHLPGVRAAVRTEADTIAGVASGLLTAHHEPGAPDHDIEVTQGRVDAFVSLVGPAPGAIEFGHFNARGGSWVDGIHVLSRAAGV